MVKKQQPEFKLQTQVCAYIRMQYKEVFFLSDTVASVKLTFAQANRNKEIQNSNFKCPDLLILEPRKGYHGLFIELKSETPYKKNGELKKDEHLEQQQKTIEKLNEKGYKSLFAWDFWEIKNVIDEYLN